MESAFTALSLSLFQSITVLTKYECFKFSVFAGMGLKHWVLLHIEFSRMFCFTKFSNCLALIVLLGLCALIEIMFNVDCWYVPFHHLIQKRQPLLSPPLL